MANPTTSGAAPAPPAPLTPDEIWARMPSAEEIFNRPYDPPGPIPPAWEGDSIAVEFADQECARLVANGLFDPPITEEEIEEYARLFGLSLRDAEIEIRGNRRDEDR